jgi:inner membrane transporter RhtA
MRVLAPVQERACPRRSFALLPTLLPASATIIGAIVLSQIPSLRDRLGIALVLAEVAFGAARAV